MKIIKNILKSIIYFIIQIIEYFEYRNLDLDEDDISKKIINSIEIEEQVLTDTGYSKATEIHITQPYRIYKVITEAGKELECADNHILFDDSYNEVFVKNLKKNDWIQVNGRLERVKSIKKSIFKQSMFDLSLDDKNHRFYTNDILSHNTISSAIFMAWYLCFHYDRNILVVANKAVTMQEIIDKIKIVYQNLPFFLKPGVMINNMQSIQFDNGVRIIGQATSATPALGFTIHLLYADEFAHIPENIVDPFYRSVYPTLSSSKISKMIITSTANGPNKFFDIYSGSTKGENEFANMRVDWWQVPGRDEKWKEQEIGNLGIEGFNQEYGNQFLQSDKMLFNEAIVKKWNNRAETYQFKEIIKFDKQNIKYDDLKWHKDYNIDYNKEDRFIISVDVAEGKGKDYTVANIFKLELYSDDEIKNIESYKDMTDFIRLKQIGMFRSNKVSINDFSELLKALTFEYFDSENVKVVYETNFQGDILKTSFSNHKNFYRNIFLRTKHSRKARVLSDGIKYNKSNKPIMCNELLYYMASDKIYIDNEDNILECTNFGIDKKGRFSSQIGNDDTVMSCVNLVAYLQNKSFHEMAGYYFDSLDESERNKIYKTLESIEKDDDDGFDFSTLKGFI